MIEQISVEQLSMPLSNPYHLSFESINVLDTFLIRMQVDGDIIVGEATVLEEYFNISVDDVWEEAQLLAGKITGETVETADELIFNDQFARITKCAFESALWWTKNGEFDIIRAPIVGIASTHDGATACLDTVKTQYRNGHHTIKIKIGFDPEHDADCLTTVFDAIPDTVDIRVDANQGYTLSDTQTFLNRIDTERLSLLEQPLPVGHLDDHAKLTRETSVPIMLDEEIQGKKSLQTIVETGAANMVKFKLMKQGGPTAVQKLTDIARTNGLGVVLGNGVQTGLGSLQEAMLWKHLDLRTAGEFNGWTKLRDPLLCPAPSFEKGYLVWEGDQMQIDDNAVDHYLKRRHVA